jgi:hypothetical protein
MRNREDFRGADSVRASGGREVAMRVRFVVFVVLILVAGLAASTSPVRAVTPPTCYDQITDQVLTATKWLDAPGTLVGTSGRTCWSAVLAATRSKGSAATTLSAPNRIPCSSRKAITWTEVPATTALSGLDGRPRRTMLHTCLQSAWQLRSMAPLWRCEGRGHATRDASTPGTDR